MKLPFLIRKSAAALGVVSLLAPSFAHAVDLVIITNSSGDSFTVAGQADGTVYQTVTGLSGPMGVAVNGTGAYIINGGTDELLLYDTANMEQEQSISVGTQARRVGVNGTGAYVVNFGDDTVSVIDTTDFQLVATVSVGDGPNDVGFSGTGAYVPNISGNSVTVIDTTDLQIVKTIAVAGAPQTVAFYGTGAYVTRYSSSLVSVIDMTTNTAEWTFSSGASPRDIVIVGTGAYITNQSANTVSVVDVTDGVMVETVSVGDSPFNINATGTGVYVANSFETTLSVIDTASLAVEDSVTTGDGPFGIAFFSDTSTLAPTLTIPASVSLCDDLAVQYVIPEEILAGTVQLQFYNETTHTSVTATLNNSSGSVSFNLNLEDFTAVGNVVSSTNNSIIAGEYTVYLSYQDYYGNTAGQDEDTSFTVTDCAASSSSSSSSSSSESSAGGGGGGGGRRGSGTTYPSSSSSSSSPRTSSSGAASAVTNKICANVEKVSPFKDVDASAWYDCYSKNVAGLKIFEGYKEIDGTPKMLFGPSDNITLGQLAKVGTILRNKEDLDPKPTGDEWFKPYVGAVQAYDAAVFVPDADPLRSATRGEVIHTILEALGIDTSGGETQYSDVSDDHPYASAIITATRLGFISGDDGTMNFRPNDPINRAEVAKMLSLALASVGIMYEDDALGHAAANDVSSSDSSVDATVCTNVLPRSYPVRATPSMAGAVRWYLAPAESVGCDASSGGWTKVYGGNATEGYVQDIVVGRR